jgi:hypothetical protein
MVHLQFQNNSATQKLKASEERVQSNSHLLAESVLRACVRSSESVVIIAPALATVLPRIIPRVSGISVRTNLHATLSAKVLIIAISNSRSSHRQSTRTKELRQLPHIGEHFLSKNSLKLENKEIVGLPVLFSGSCIVAAVSDSDSNHKTMPFRVDCMRVVKNTE